MRSPLNRGWLFVKSWIVISIDRWHHPVGLSTTCVVLVAAAVREKGKKRLDFDSAEKVERGWVKEPGDLLRGQMLR